MSHDPSGLFKPYRSWLNPGLCLESWNFPPSFLGFSSSCSGTPHATVRMGGGCATNRKNNTEQYIFIVLLQHSLWIQPYLLRKWDWGMIWGCLVPSQEVFGSIGHSSIVVFTRFFLSGFHRILFLKAHPNVVFSNDIYMIFPSICISQHSQWDQVAVPYGCSLGISRVCSHTNQHWWSKHLWTNTL